MSIFFKIVQNENQRLTKQDFLIGTIIAFALLIAFTLGSSGMSLIATFVPGLIFSWSLFAFLYFKKIDLPDFNIFLPVYLLTLGWQFIHFSEEFTTNFKELFPIAYGGQPYTNNTFVIFNMSAYFVFIVTPILVYFKGLKFLFIPILFFTVYGAMGNAISHTWWRIYYGEYFPGFYTAQLYWVLAPILLTMIIKSRKVTGIYIIVFSIVLLTTLTLLME
ncbi:hypothetical protein P8625_06470 [Tenacibaculum tangerinum]|uniref:Uncharacterized protein n=1 Tax=Tenacibaculum tangerinum TaxID=3038772 RepID=A0ABY8L841_9FLAO|nr:hypothetical protein [Tenacibaculum tangerinum]WGH76787.1 hypothetical protein P8625_06470 [Tenacibaculum tangerinum]